MKKFLVSRARITWWAHFLKAVLNQDHREMVPGLSCFVPRNGIVIDVGAHAGQFTKLFSRMAPAGRVYAFEPGAYALSILRKVRVIKRLGNVVIVPFALGQKPSKATLIVPLKRSGSVGFGLSSISPVQGDRKFREDKILVTTLDIFLKKNGIEHVHLIKADIEGWELKMLQGARKTLERCKPVLMLELNEAALRRAGSSVIQLTSFLKDFGYSMVEQRGDAIFVHDTHVVSGR